MEGNEKEILELNSKVTSMSNDLEVIKKKVEVHDQKLIESDKNNIIMNNTLTNISKSVERIENIAIKTKESQDALKTQITNDKIKQLEKADNELTEWKKEFIKKAIKIILALIASGGTVGTIVYNCIK